MLIDQSKCLDSVIKLFVTKIHKRKHMYSKRNEC